MWSSAKEKLRGNKCNLCFKVDISRIVTLSYLGGEELCVVQSLTPAQTFSPPQAVLWLTCVLCCLSTGILSLLTFLFLCSSPATISHSPQLLGYNRRWGGTCRLSLRWDGRLAAFVQKADLFVPWIC
uniref:Uncharacterized protein n=1 Tax=Sphaerodactylus townsendi TaxID=933632 RepID=A0ACB8EUL4_9SAUR